MTDRYTITPVNGIDTLHRNPSLECDPDRKDGVDAKTGQILVDGGYIRRCPTCNAPASTVDGSPSGHAA